LMRQATRQKTRNDPGVCGQLCGMPGHPKR
jgi:hypothetical protein